MFSSNESFNEIPSTDIKYLLLPFFLAQLTLKINSTDVLARKNIVETAEVYYTDYLRRCAEYSMTDWKEEKRLVSKAGENSNQNELEELKQMATQRNDKLRKYREMKELASKIEQMKVAIDREESIDEADQREFYADLIRLSAMEAVDELKSIGQEKQILDFKGQVPETDSHALKHRHHPSKPLKPIIITKDALQKAVYGRGYPSLPTMTVEEFYLQRVADGIFPDPNSTAPKPKSRMEMTDDEVAEEENKERVAIEEAIEQDDEMYLARQRNMDEFKDDVRRGDGNRHNRS